MRKGVTIFTVHLPELCPTGPFSTVCVGANTPPPHSQELMLAGRAQARRKAAAPEPCTPQQVRGAAPSPAEARMKDT